MSILFKFVGSSFLLTFGIILLVCGSIMLYSYRRFNLLERSVIEHGKILQSFILNYNIQMQSMNSLYNKNKVEKEEVEQIKKINLGDKLSDKIYVSENECSEDECSEDECSEKEVSDANIIKDISQDKSDDDDDDDDDEDDDGDDEDDDDEEDDDEEVDDDDDDDDDDDEDDEKDEKDEKGEDEESENNDEDNNTNEDENGENMHEFNIAKLLTISKKELEKNIKDLGDFEEINLIKPFFSNNDDDETFIKNLPVNLDTFNIDLNNNSKIINLNNLENANVETVETVDNGVTKKNYSKMKVDDLKTIAVTRNLIDNETAHKMKKADLIKIIQNA